MLFFYALLFFLFFASVASTPLRSSTPGPGQERRHQGYAIQRAATSLGKRPAPRRPEDGYWVLKRPQVSGMLFKLGFQASHSCHSKPIDILNGFCTLIIKCIVFSR